MTVQAFHSVCDTSAVPCREFTVDLSWTVCEKSVIYFHGVRKSDIRNILYFSGEILWEVIFGMFRSMNSVYLYVFQSTTWNVVHIQEVVKYFVGQMLTWYNMDQILVRNVDLVVRWPNIWLLHKKVTTPEVWSLQESLEVGDYTSKFSWRLHGNMYKFPGQYVLHDVPWICTILFWHLGCASTHLYILCNGFAYETRMFFGILNHHIYILVLCTESEIRTGVLCNWKRNTRKAKKNDGYMYKTCISTPLAYGNNVAPKNWNWWEQLDCKKRRM